MNNSTSIFKFITLRSPKPTKADNSEFKIFRNTALIKKLSEINKSTEDPIVKSKKINEQLQKLIDSDKFIKNKWQVSESNSIDDLYNNIVVRILTNSNTNEIYGLLVEKIKKVHIKKLGLTENESKKVRVVFPENLVLTFGNTLDEKEERKDNDENKITSINKEIKELENLKKSAKLALERGVLKFEPKGKMVVKDTRFTKITQELNTDSITVKEAEKKIADSIKRVETEIESENTLEKTKLLQELQIAIGEAKIKGDTSFKMSSFTKFKALSKDIRTESDNIEEVEAQVKSKIQPLLFEQENINASKEKLAILQSVQAEISIAKAQNETVLSHTVSIENKEFVELGNYVLNNNAELFNIEQLIIAKLEELYRDFYGLTPSETYTYIGETWVDTSKFESTFNSNEDSNENSISVYMGGCQLKFPIQIADLRVVEHQTVGYLPGEIAHINNTQPGEKNTKVTRRLKKIDSYESFINEQEVFKETDTQSTDKFSVEKTASQVQTEEESVNVNASVSAKYGPVKASVDAGYSNTNSTTNSNSSANSYAKEVVQRVVDRISNKVRTERSSRTIEEFEETVTHVIDNTDFDSPKSYVYRWLNKLTRATLKNYGKRLIFNIDVAHPANYYLSKSIQDQPKLSIPPNPRTLEINGVRMFTVERITRENYLLWADLYKTNLEMPPSNKIIISDNFSTKNSLYTNKLIPITKGYECKKAIISNTYGSVKSQIRYIVGNNVKAYFNAQSDSGLEINLNNESVNLPISIYHGQQGMIFSLEIECSPTPETYREWQIKCYQAIIEGYENLKAEAEAQMTEWNPNLPGLHPLKKTALINTELKKEALKKMFRCTPFWISDDYKVGNEYQTNCCKDSLNAEKIRFLETVFDWENMTWELYPYYYADKDNWAKLLNLSDDDPMFEAFLQSSFATVRIPVHRDVQKEVAALNFMMNNSIANYETLPESMEDLLEDLSDQEITSFEYDIKGNPLPAPKEKIDLGIFPLPTDLVILECGTENGIKPTAFPMKEDEESKEEASIPKQYSPTIISDSCLAKPIDSNKSE